VGEVHLTWPLRGHRWTRDLPPGLKPSRHLLAVHSGREEVAPGTEGRRERTIGGEEAWGLPGRYTSPPRPLALARWLVGVFSPMVEGAALPRLDAGQQRSLGRLMAPQHVGHDHPRHVCEALEELPEELLGGCRVAPASHQAIEDVAVMVHRAPEIVALAVNREKRFIRMPFVSRSGLSTAQLVRIGLAGCAATIPYGFICEGVPALRHQRRAIPAAEAKTEVQPDPMAGDLGREPLALVGISDRSCDHAASMPHAARVGKEGK
jgi:hypothetical protein